MGGTYTDLQVWQAAMDLAEEIYRITKTFPKEETYSLTVQLRRAAVSQHRGRQGPDIREGTCAVSLPLSGIVV